MKKSKKLLIVFLAAVQLFLFAACSGRNDPIDPGTLFSPVPVFTANPSSETDPSVTETPADSTEAPLAPVQSPIFTEEIRKTYPQPLSQERIDAINEDLEALLAKKTYSESAKKLIRDTVAAAIQGQPEFQSLFGFLKPHGTEEYIRKYFLEPLDTMVDTLRFCSRTSPEDTAWWAENASYNWAGFFNEEEKLLGIIESDSRGWDMSVLAHELHHALLMKEHRVLTTNLYGELIEGGASFYQLTLLNSYYVTIAQMRYGDMDYFNEDNGDCFKLRGGSGTAYMQQTNKYFKLLALTDFETMELLSQPEGELKIREYLTDRYGEDGGLFFDILDKYPTTFDDIADSEALFLKMFVSRMQEISSPADFVSYFQLYRIYRRVYCAQYIPSEFPDINASPEIQIIEPFHPKVNYSVYDEMIAAELLKQNVLNAGQFSEEEKETLARTLIAWFTPINHMTLQEYSMYYGDEYFTLIRSDYKLMHVENGDIAIEILSPTGLRHTIQYSVERKCFYKSIR